MAVRWHSSSTAWSKTGLSCVNCTGTMQLQVVICQQQLGGVLAFIGSVL